MKRLIIGTAGHIDHGKSELVRALTGIDPDRLKEEKERGITIELGFASLTLPSGTRAGIVDVPGHEKFVRTMVAGATGIDLLILVIAADEGIMPQTKEHADICRLLGIDRGLVALTKVDKVENEWISLVEEEVRNFLDSSFLKDAPIVKVSSLSGEGLELLLQTIDDLAETIEERSPDRPLKFPIDRVFTLKGIGTVVTGTLVSGSFIQGDELWLYPGEKEVRIRYIESHGEKMERAIPGSRTAANLSGISVGEVRRGDMLSRSGEAFSTRSIDALVENLPVHTKPFTYGTRVNIHYGTTYGEAIIQPYGKKKIFPGENGIARIRLLSPAMVLGKERFILRGFSRLKNFGYTVGGGIVLNPFPPKRRPGKIEKSPGSLIGLLNGDSRIQILSLAEEQSGDPFGEKRGALATGLEFSSVAKELRSLCKEGDLYQTTSGEYLLRSSVNLACRSLHEALLSLSEQAKAKVGFPRSEVVAKTKISPYLAGEAFKILQEQGTVIKTDEGYLPSSALTDRSQHLEKSEERILSFIEGKRVAGPTAGEIAKEVGASSAETGQILVRLSREGAIQRNRDFFFSTKVLRGVEKILLAYLKDNESITISDFKDLTGTTRKFAVPLMELMDQRKVTIRKGNIRVPWKK